MTTNTSLEIRYTHSRNKHTTRECREIKYTHNTEGPINSQQIHPVQTTLAETRVYNRQIQTNT